MSISVGVSAMNKLRAAGPVESEVYDGFLVLSPGEGKLKDALARVVPSLVIH